MFSLINGKEHWKVKGTHDGDGRTMVGHWTEGARE